MTSRTTILALAAGAAAVFAGCGPPALVEDLPPPAPPVDEIFHQDVAWSPDGEWLAFSEYRGGSSYREGGWTVQVVRPDGSDRRELVLNGKRIAFIAGMWPRSAIYVMDASGARIRKIAN